MLSRSRILLLFHRIAAVLAGQSPEYSSGDIGDLGTTLFEVVFSLAVVSGTSDYESGVTIKLNSISQTISFAERQADHRKVQFTIVGESDADDVLTFEYDDDFGDYAAEIDDTPMVDISAQTLLNEVGSHLYFDTPACSGWVAI